MHETFILAAILILLIIVFFLCYSSILNKPAEGLESKDILQYGRNNRNKHKDRDSAYIKFCHLVPCLPGFVDIFVGGKLILKNAHFGKISPDFVKIKSGENKVSILSGPKEVFTEIINFREGSYDICVASNLDNILKIESKQYSQFLNVTDSYGPLFVIIKGNGNNNRYKLNYGTPKPINLQHGNYAIVVEDIKGKVILRNTINVDDCKIFTLGGNINKIGCRGDGIGIHVIRENCGRTQLETKHILDISEMSENLSEKFGEDQIEGEWDNETEDLSDIHGNQ